MLRYVTRRVKDTIELTNNVRKSFGCQQNENIKSQQQQQQQQSPKKTNTLTTYSEPKFYFLEPNCGPSKKRYNDDFKKKYNHNPYRNQFLNALTWSTAIICGFYTSQLLCLYRRKHVLNLDGNRCYYSKYLKDTTKSFHKNVKVLLESDNFPKCPRSKAFRQSNPEQTKKNRSWNIKDELRIVQEDKFFDPRHQGFLDKRFTKLYEDNEQLFNISNDTNELQSPEDEEHQLYVIEEKLQQILEQTEDQEKSNLSAPLDTIENAFQNLLDVIGEIEFQMGLQNVLAENYETAAAHFKLSTSHQNMKATFNLGLLYENGLGVKKDMKYAMKLYELASKKGHPKAIFNLGVFYAQGLGGIEKNFQQARKLFEQASALGNTDAIEALALINKPPPINFYQHILEHENFEKYNPVKNSVSGDDNQMNTKMVAML